MIEQKCFDTGNATGAQDLSIGYPHLPLDAARSHMHLNVTAGTYLLRTLYKKLSYRRGTARCVVSVEILPIATQQCRNYLYDKS